MTKTARTVRCTVRVLGNSLGVAVILFTQAALFDHTEVASLSLMIPWFVIVEVAVQRATKASQQHSTGRANPFVAFALCALLGLAVDVGVRAYAAALRPATASIVLPGAGARAAFTVQQRPWETPAQAYERFATDIANISGNDFDRKTP